ncbi:uncharacterized protein LOC136037071 [Artemia franciscana]|uniref:uncharacterized protein LOC136037071 n=1 Tax=Artemia franciscana TaxID=6661 RepID=UPI0032DA22A2
MNSFLAVLATLLVATNAKYVARVASLTDCGGTILTGTGAIFTDPILVPGEASGQFDFVLSADLPLDAIVEKRVFKIDTQEQVPCLGAGFLGSCTIRVCDALASIPDIFCPFFPPNLPCECPLLATSGSVPLTLNIPEAYIQFGPGDYEQVVRVYSEADPETNLACADLKYTLINA